jgi:hypothetical protein
MFVAAQDLEQDKADGDLRAGDAPTHDVADAVLGPRQLLHGQDQGGPQNRYRSHKMR